MVKLADIGAFVWVIIFVVITVAKGWSKLQESKENRSPDSGDVPQPAPPPRLPVSRPRPSPGTPPMPRVPRAVPPAMRRPIPHSVPAPTPAARKVSADDIRRVVEQMSRKPQPAQPAQQPRPVPAPPVAMTQPPAPPPVPKLQEPNAPEQPIADLPAATVSKADAPAAAESSRASQWAEALRDRQNLRNIIVACEIIGRPRAELV